LGIENREGQGAKKNAVSGEEKLREENVKHGCNRVVGTNDCGKSSIGRLGGEVLHDEWEIGIGKGTLN